MKHSSRKRSAALLVVTALLAGSAAGSTATAEKVKVGLGYLPDVQFAPFYAAEKAGFYAKRGLEVEFEHGFANTLYPLLSAGRLDFVVADADDVILYRTAAPRGEPYRFVLALYQQVPNALFSKVEKNIKTVRDLRGKTIGMPALSGVSYTSLLAMLRAAGLRESDVQIKTIGFEQVSAVLANRVDVAMGYLNNEPLQLAARGVKVNVIKAAPYNSAPGNGVITTDATLAKKDLVRRFLAATQEGMALTIAEPRRAFDYTKSFVSNLAEDRFKVLTASTPLYQSAYSRAHGLGFSNPDGWSRTVELLKSTGRVKTSLASTAFFTNAFLTPGVQPKQ